MELKDSNKIYFKKNNFYIKQGGNKMKKLFSLTLLAFATLFLVSCIKKTNKAPVITGAKDTTIELNGTFNPLDGVTVKDEDEDIELQVFGWQADFAKQAGTYEIAYFAIDSHPTKPLHTIVTATVTVGDATGAPVISGVNTEQNHYQTGTAYNPFGGVTAVSGSGSNLTEEIETANDPIDDTVEGVYGVILFVEDDNKAATKVIVLFVQGNLPDELDANQKIELVMHHAMGEANQNLLKKYAESFTAIYPNVTVTIPDTAGNYDTLKDNTISNLAAGDFPNLVQSYPDHVAEYLNSKAVINLNPYIYHEKHGFSAEESLEDIVASYREENSQYDEAGTFYSLPFNKSTEVVVYNKTAFDALGLTTDDLKTWQSIMAIAPRLKAYGEGLGKTNVVPVAYDSSGNGFISLTKQWGGQYTEIDFETGKGRYLWNGDANTNAAMEFFKKYSVNNGGSGLFTLPDYWDQQYASTPFINQQAFITIGSTAGVRHNMPQDKSFVVDTAPVPYNADMPQNRAVIQQGTNIALLTKGDAQIDLAAWLFLKHIISTENTLDWAMKTGYVPVRESAFNSVTYQNFLDTPLTDQNGSALGAKGTFPQRDFMFYDPAFPGSSRARANVGGALERIINGDGNIVQALDEAYKASMIGQA